MTELPVIGSSIPQAVSLASVLLLGLSMGLTACTVTCLPYMGVWVLGQGSDRRQAFIHTGLFLAGRVSVYILLGGLAGGLGQWLARWLAAGWGNGAIGLASLGAGLWLLRPSRGSCRAQSARNRTPPFLLGVALAMTPCAPLASLLTLAALGGSGVEGAAYGLAFGLGAVFSPLLVLLPALAWFGRRLREDRLWLSRWITWMGAAVLILLGVRRLTGLL